MGNTPSADVAQQKVEDQLVDRNSCKEEDMMKASMLWEPALQLGGEEDPIFDDFVILDKKKKTMKEQEEKTDLDQDSFVVVDDREEERNKESEQDQHVQIVMNDYQSMPIPEPLVVREKKLISVQKKQKRVVRQDLTACLACKERIVKGQHVNQIQHNQCSFLCAHCKVHLMPGEQLFIHLFALQGNCKTHTFLFAVGFFV